MFASRKEVLAAIRNRDKHNVVSLLNNTGKPEEAKESSNWTLLHYAAYCGWTDVCQLLVEQYQVDPHVKSSGNEWTALHEACQHNRIDTVKYLISQAHCDPLIVDKNGSTSLSLSRGETKQFLQEIIDQSKKEGFTNVSDFTKATLKEKQYIFDEAMAKGGGDLFQCNIVFHGPPGAGKSSVKDLILGKPPSPKHLQTATNIVDKCVHTVKVDRVAATSNRKYFEEIDNDDIITRITADVEKYRKQKKSPKAQDQSSSFSNTNSTVSNHETLPEETTSYNAESVGGIMSPAVKNPSGDHSPSTHTKTVESIRTNLLRHFLSSYKTMFDFYWLHHIDSGGQPQFLDVFPLMYHSPNSHFVVVTRLTDGLDERPKVRFYIEGSDEYCLPDHLVLSNREMIIRMCQVARRISQATGGKFTPCVFIVGTHDDKLKPIIGSRRRKNINSELLRIHEEYEDVLVCKTPGEQVMFMINAMAEGKERVQHMEELQRHILSSIENVINPINVPLQWLILHLEL